MIYDDDLFVKVILAQNTLHLVAALLSVYNAQARYTLQLVTVV